MHITKKTWQNLRRECRAFMAAYMSESDSRGVFNLCIRIACIALVAFVFNEAQKRPFGLDTPFLIGLIVVALVLIVVTHMTNYYEKKANEYITLISLIDDTIRTYGDDTPPTATYYIYVHRMRAIEAIWPHVDESLVWDYCQQLLGMNDEQLKTWDRRYRLNARFE